MDPLNEIKNRKYPTKLDLIIMYYGDEQIASDEDLLDAEQAAEELIVLRKMALLLKEVSDRVPGLAHGFEDDNGVSLGNRIEDALKFLIF